MENDNDNNNNNNNKKSKKHNNNNNVMKIQLPPICEDVITINLLKHLVLIKQSNGNIFTATNFNNKLWYNPNNQLYYSVENTRWRPII